MLVVMIKKFFIIVFMNMLKITSIYWSATVKSLLFVGYQFSLFLWVA